MFSEKIREIPSDTDMIILPEMFTTGFTMNPERVNAKEGEFTVKPYHGALYFLTKCFV